MEAPLRKITGLEYHGDLYQGNSVRLECGHTTWTSAIYKTRCVQCLIEEENKKRIKNVKSTIENLESVKKYHIKNDYEWAIDTITTAQKTLKLLKEKLEEGNNK